MSGQLSRKDFIVKSVAGVAALSLIPGSGLSGQEDVHLRKLGSTGMMVSPICFGAPRTNDESLIKYSVEKGMNFIDTGRAYGNGNNEKLVGKAVSGIRKNVIIQSKIKLEMNELPSQGKGRKGALEIREALSTKFEASLKAIDSDYFDVLLVHGADDENLLFHSETLKFFDSVKKAGRIKSHGFSTHNDRLNLLSRNNKEGFYDVVMVPFNHKGSYIHSVNKTFAEWDQNKLISLLTEAGEKGKGVIAMKTCSGGPYSPDTDGVPDFFEAVKWVLRHKFISSAAVALASFEQVDQHLPLLKID